MTTISHSLTWLHLGLGSFHRAHQAAYLQALINAGDRRWRISAGNIRPDTDAIGAHIQQQGFYTLETIDSDGKHQYERIDAINQVFAYEPSLKSLIHTGAQAHTHIISFTVTEAGYYLNDHGALNLDAPEIIQDWALMAQGHVGQTLYGAMTHILKERMLTSGAPVTLLNCDNLRHNGTRFRTGLLSFIRHFDDPALTEWVERSISCPNAMVDRITPRPTEAVMTRVHAATGLHDPAALMSEAFCQWVIEDDFCAERPEWERVGVQMVDSVLAFEEAKIRILNATHSGIAWASQLMGYDYIHQGVRHPDIHRFVHDYITQAVIPALSPSQIDLAQYRDITLTRFANAALLDTVARVAMDSFAKIPGYIVPTFHDCLRLDVRMDALAVLPALFLQFLQRWHRGELGFDYQDQAMDPEHAHAICEASDPIVALCAHQPLWGSLTNHPRIVQAVRQADARVHLWLTNPAS